MENLVSNQKKKSKSDQDDIHNNNKTKKKQILDKGGQRQKSKDCKKQQFNCIDFDSGINCKINFKLGH